MSLRLPKCDFCMHYHTESKNDTCDAFPNGIPLEIMCTDESQECHRGIKYKDKYVIMSDDTPLLFDIQSLTPEQEKELNEIITQAINHKK